MPVQSDVSQQNAPASSAGATSPAGGGTGGQTIPYERFKEVNDRMTKAEADLKAYADLGFSAAEVQEALLALAYVVEQGQKTQAASSGNAQSDGTQASGKDGQFTQQQWEEWAFKTFPWMREVKEAHSRQQEEAEARTGWLVAASQKRLTELAKAQGYTDKQMKALENAISGVIAADPAMLDAWRNGDLSVVEAAFKSHTTEFVEPVARQYAASVSGRKALNKVELAPRVAGGTAPAPEKPAKPKNLAEAHDVAMAKLAEMGTELPEDEGSVEET